MQPLIAKNDLQDNRLGDFANAKAPSALPEHLIQLFGEWRVWRCVVLRGAGFAASQVLKLAAPECARAADNLIKAQEEREDSCQQLLQNLRVELDTVRLQQPADETARRALLNKALRDVKRGKLPKLSGFSANTQDALSRLCKADLLLEPARKTFRQRFAEGSANTLKELVATAASEPFREAVLWQNRRAVHSGLDALLREAADKQQRGSKQRQHEELVASYLQRYTVKNDTIGFFGPVGWARFVDDEELIVCRPGSRFVQKREVYFEGWAIDKVAETLAQNEALRPWAVPRLMPFLHLDGVRLYIPLQKPLPITAQQSAVLQACDGEQTAEQLADRLLQNHALGFRRREEIYHLLEALNGKGLIAWTIEVPLVLRPDQRLRRIIEGITDHKLRQPILEILDELEAGRAAVAGAAGDCESLNRALGNLDEIFTRVTGSAPLKPGGEGKTYSSRTLVYEDCRRDIEVEIGTEFLRALGEPLSLLLTSARWLTYELAARMRKIFKQLYENLAHKSGSATIEAVNFWYNLVPILFEGKQSPVDPLVPILQQRWADILELPQADCRRLHYHSEELRERVAAAFAAPAPGWASARYHSPDVMIAAADLAALERGDYQLVLGEIHLGINTAAANLFVAQHSSPEDFQKFYAADFPEPRVIAIVPKSWPQATTRTQTLIANPQDYLLMVTQDSLGAPKSQALNIGSLVIEPEGDGLVIRTRDGRLNFDLIEAFGDVLSMLVVNSFKLLRPQSHTPRITFDRLVVSRESWNFTPEDAYFAWEKTDLERFIEARRWRLEKAMPRFIFYKSPIEAKPSYVDFDSPIGLEMFARSIRRLADKGASNSTISASEMLPGAEQNWLRDHKGTTFTSELRIIAVDPARKFPSSEKCAIV
ncbi:MAG: lantibiotic dehydratase [Acidobacteria bacterium]|nr:lantibiotic dehydratase [Acidobacteriota bacterium]